MNIVLNIELLNKFGITIEESLTLLKIADKTLNLQLNESLLEGLQERMFIKIIVEDNSRIIAVREKGNEVLKSLYGQKVKFIKPKADISADFQAFVNSYRRLWKGLKPGSMGSDQDCKEKLMRWMKENPEYSTDDILRAAKLYINSLNDYKYLQQANYFIYKKDGTIESSRLSAFIDEKDTAVDDGWTNKLA